MKRNVDIHDVGNSALYLLSDLGGGVTGEIHYVDAGYNKVGMPDPKILLDPMSKRYSGKSFKDSSVMKKPKLSFKEKRKIEKRKKIENNVSFGVVCCMYNFCVCTICIGKSGHALELFAIISAIAFFLISKIKHKIK